ncbi:MAG: GNAT family N-acetyltransferase [Synechococcaceae cyanobacterium RM1_1_27]|nr:GNAT family N-acetyltransferase [Synechococcaceae cyanobacterium RM1_1_27]
MSAPSTFVIKAVETDQERAQAFEVRRQVFQQEQGVSAEEEFDQYDDTALHVVVLAQAGSLGIATARIRVLEDEPKVPKRAKIERMAVLADYRGLAVGRKLMEFILEHLIQQGFREAKLHAQLQARGFYERLGFIAQDQVFEEAGIPHCVMTRSLK